jgi:hypothetical protein
MMAGVLGEIGVSSPGFVVVLDDILAILFHLEVVPLETDESHIPSRRLPLCFLESIA